MNTEVLVKQFGLAGRGFVITGASSGLGRAMSTFLAQAGASVLLVARRQAALEQLTEQIQRSGGQAAFVVADLSERENLGEIASQCKAIVPGSVIDGVVNAAGVNLREAVDDVSLQSWDTTLNLNLSVPFFFSREFIAEMRERNYGRVINIASLQSSRAFANGLAYGASKGGVCQLTRAMAEAWSQYNITCNAIAPGFFPTELTATVFDNSKTRQWAANATAIGRNGELDDLFGITVFFASQSSAYITGQTLHIDGGFTAR
jgi:NAD(P)-dependent dehydrogenase (short-subunit alcohol dehydrogenase family)